MYKITKLKYQSLIDLVNSRDTLSQNISDVITVILPFWSLRKKQNFLKAVNADLAGKEFSLKSLLGRVDFMNAILASLQRAGLNVCENSDDINLISDQIMFEETQSVDENLNNKSLVFGKKNKDKDIGKTTKPRIVNDENIKRQLKVFVNQREIKKRRSLVTVIAEEKTDIEITFTFSKECFVESVGLDVWFTNSNSQTVRLARFQQVKSKGEKSIRISLRMPPHIFGDGIYCFDLGFVYEEFGHTKKYLHQNVIKIAYSFPENFESHRKAAINGNSVFEGGID
jgi:hypothetical protein